MTTANNYDARLAELGLTLPVPAVPIANFVPCVQVGNTLYVSGQVPRENGQLAFAGKVGRDLDVEQGRLPRAIACSPSCHWSTPTSARSTGCAALPCCNVSSTRCRSLAIIRKSRTGPLICWWRCLAMPGAMRALRSAPARCRATLPWKLLP